MVANDVSNCFARSDAGGFFVAGAAAGLLSELSCALLEFSWCFEVAGSGCRVRVWCLRWGVWLHDFVENAGKHGCLLQCFCKVPLCCRVLQVSAWCCRVPAQQNFRGVMEIIRHGYCPKHLLLSGVYALAICPVLFLTPFLGGVSYCLFSQVSIECRCSSWCGACGGDAS